jgi:hypothetical protein
VRCGGEPIRGGTRSDMVVRVRIVFASDTSGVFVDNKFTTVSSASRLDNYTSLSTADAKVRLAVLQPDRFATHTSACATALTSRLLIAILSRVPATSRGAPVATVNGVRWQQGCTV